MPSESRAGDQDGLVQLTLDGLHVRSYTLVPKVVYLHRAGKRFSLSFGPGGVRCPLYSSSARGLRLTLCSPPVHSALAGTREGNTMCFPRLLYISLAPTP